MKRCLQRKTCLTILPNDSDARSASPLPTSSSGLPILDKGAGHTLVGQTAPKGTVALSIGPGGKRRDRFIWTGGAARITVLVVLLPMNARHPRRGFAPCPDATAASSSSSCSCF